MTVVSHRFVGGTFDGYLIVKAERLTASKSRPQDPNDRTTMTAKMLGAMRDSLHIAPYQILMMKWTAM
jgi:hypothetical protein